MFCFSGHLAGCLAGRLAACQAIHIGVSNNLFFPFSGNRMSKSPIAASTPQRVNSQINKSQFNKVGCITNLLRRPTRKPRRQKSLLNPGNRGPPLLRNELKEMRRLQWGSTSLSMPQRGPPWRSSSSTTCSSTSPCALAVSYV